MTDIAPGKLETFQRKLLNWAEDGNLRDFPWRRTNSPYEVLVAEILLGATPATKAESLYEQFLGTYPDVEALATADQDELANLLEPLGLHNRRASAFVSLGQDLRGGVIPRTEDGLRELDYVGRYAANATLCFAFDQRRPILDTNVIRIYRRVFGVDLDEESPASWETAADLLPEDHVQTYNLALLDLGAKICTSTSPNCGQCPMTDICEYYDRERRNTPEA